MVNGLPSIPAVFILAGSITVALVFGATIVGRYLSGLLPVRLRPLAKFYLAPALGLALFTVGASIVGRWLPLGNWIIAAVLSLGPICWAILREPFKGRMLLHAVSNSLFSLAAGISMLAPLLVFGAFNAHNDAFTYLAHSGWLQNHAFSNTIEPGLITPVTTQIAMYQHFGFRMGSSFFIALVQSIFGLRWAYAAYPAVIISAIFSTCLSLGFPISAYLRRFSRRTRLLVLCFPAFGFGGLVFAANFGFLPQTLGLTFACSLLFLSGSVFKWFGALETDDMRAVLKPAILSALLLSAFVFAYSEFVPFVGLAILIVAIATMIQSKNKLAIIAYGVFVLVFATLFLNLEIVRAFTALKLQSGAVVGTPVNWTLIGFIAHALGTHGGAWDTFQWALPSGDWVSYGAGVFTVLLLTALLAHGCRGLSRSAKTPHLLPITTMLVILSLGLLYFRYLVPSPFSVGVGQSWSQFKLADWAHPFVSVFVLLAFFFLLSKMGKWAAKTVTAFFALGFVAAGVLAVERVKPVVKSYGDVHDLARFYTDFRDAVLTSCPPLAPLYLALGDSDQKIRQIATLYLPDRQVLADWKGDDYVQAWLPEADRRGELVPGQCIVERQSSQQISVGGRNVGAFTVGAVPDVGRILIGVVQGAHDQETNGKDWWRWIEREVSFELQPRLVDGQAMRTRVRFAYQTRGPQTITLALQSDGGNEGDSVSTFAVKSTGEGSEVFDHVFDVPPADIRRLHMTTNGVAFPLQEPDTRSAAWRIENLHIEPS